MGQITNEMWQIIAKETQDYLLNSKLKAIYEKVYDEGFLKGSMANREAVAVADCVCTWMADNSLQKELPALTLLWDKLEGEDRKTVFRVMSLLASINVTIEHFKRESTK